MAHSSTYNEDEVRFTAKGYRPCPFRIPPGRAGSTNLVDAYFDGYPQISESEGSRVQYKTKAEKDIEITLQDGVKLYADVYRPDAEGRFPALLAWGMWGKDSQEAVFWLRDFPQPYVDAPFWDGSLEAGDTQYLASHGYVHVIPDPRGIGKSGGTVESLLDLHNPSDIREVIEWITGQPWSDGKVGMIGPSSYAFSQALVGQDPPNGLIALFPIAFWYPGELTFNGMRDATLYNIFHGGHGNDSTLPVSKNSYGTPLTLGLPKDQLDALLRQILNDADIRFNSKFYSVFRYPLKDPMAFDLFVQWFHPLPPPGDLRKVQLPVYIGAALPGGGHRIYWTGFEAWEKVTTPSTRKKMIILPPGELARPVVDYHDEYLRWFDYWLKGVKTQILDEPPIKTFVLGVQKWKFEDEWPPTRVKWVKFFPQRDGRLSSRVPRGGKESFTQPSPNTDSEVYCLRYATKSFDEDTEVIGPVALYVEASIDKEDTSWIADLIDVGKQEINKQLLSQGWLRASFRALDESKSRPWWPVHPIREPEPVKPGERYKYAIAMMPTAAVIKKGHRLMLVIRNQDSPLARMALYGVYHLPLMTTVTHTVYYGKDSYLLFPVTGTGKDVRRRLNNGRT